MWLKINRYGAMCHWRGLLTLGILVLGGTLFTVFSRHGQVFSENKLYLVVDLLLLAFFVIFYPLRFPKEAYVDRSMISYATLQWYRRRFVRNGWMVKVHYTVTSIEEVELIQNGIERLFNIGRIRFRGNTDLDSQYDEDRFWKKDTHILSGVTNFQEVRKELQQYFARVREA